MALNERYIRELLDASTPGPWKYKLEDVYIMDDLVEVLAGRMQTDDGKTVLGVGIEINDDQELQNLTLAALAPELAQDWLRMRSDLGHLARILEDFADGPDAVPADTFAAHLIHQILNWETSND